MCVRVCVRVCICVCDGEDTTFVLATDGKKINEETIDQSNRPGLRSWREAVARESLENWSNMPLLGSANKQGLSGVAPYHRCSSQHCLPLADRGHPTLEPGPGTRGSPHVPGPCYLVRIKSNTSISRGRERGQSVGPLLLLAQGGRGEARVLLTGPSHLSQRSLEDPFQAYWRG